MVKMKTGTVVYVNRWPERLDLLELVYYPIVMIILPNVAAFICRCMDFMMDGFILLARKTTHRQLHGGKNPPKGYRVSFWMGGICNTVALWLNKTIYKKHPLKRDYVLRFAEKERVFKDVNKIIVASVSFSLLMFGIGIIITVLYLFMVR